MSKELWLQGYHDATEGRERRKFIGEHEESKYPPYDEGYEAGLKTICSKCGEEAQPDTDPPMCTECLMNKAGVPPVVCFCDWLDEVTKLTKKEE